MIVLSVCVVNCSVKINAERNLCEKKIKIKNTYTQRVKEKKII